MRERERGESNQIIGMTKQISHSFLQFNIIYGLSFTHDFMFSAAKIRIIYYISRNAQR